MNNPQRTSLLMPPTAHLAPSARRYRRSLKQVCQGERVSYVLPSPAQSSLLLENGMTESPGLCTSQRAHAEIIMEGLERLRWSILSKVENKGLSDRSGSMRSFREYRRTWLCGKHQVRQNASHLNERKLGNLSSFPDHKLSS